MVFPLSLRTFGFMKDTINDMEEVVKSILLRNAKLSQQNTELSHQNTELSQHNAELGQRVSALESENEKLRAQLSRVQSPVKDSRNSSIPPSKENIKSQSERRACSLRGTSDRSTGGQVGHQGSTLLMNPNPDIIETHTPEYCSKCGLSLSEVAGKEVEVRQSVDIPVPICPVITNHVSVEKKCSCGKCNRGSFPSSVKTGVSYGPNLHAAVAYLSTVQHIPFKRLVETINDFYGIKISQGTVSNMLNRMRKQSKSAYEAIRQRIEQSAVVGADETGEHLNGKLHWMWVFQNLLLTYIFQHPSRGKAAIDEHFPEGLPQSVLVTDRHSSYFNMETAGHQLCLAHLLRELLYLDELDSQQKWTTQILELLRNSIHQRKTIPFDQIDIGEIGKRFDDLLEQDLLQVNQKIRALQKSLIKHREHILQFLVFEELPYDNNASERAIRPIKVKQKVSGTFKSNDAADAFCQLFSIVDTARKNSQDPFLALIAVAENITTQ